MQLDESATLANLLHRRFAAYVQRHGQSEPLPVRLWPGVSDGWKLDHDEVEFALDKYFEFCGWDVKTGNPTRIKMEELDLGWVADQLGIDG